MTRTSVNPVEPILNNDIQSFSMYKQLEKPLSDFLQSGDGIYALPVYEEQYFPHAAVIDISMINLIKFIATAFGRVHVPQAYTIVNFMRSDLVRKTTFRFRSRHPLFVSGNPHYQNLCLISGMIHLGIPILPYFDGTKIIEIEHQDEYADYEKHSALLRAQYSDVL